MTPAAAIAARHAQQDNSMSQWVVASILLSNITHAERVARQWRSGPIR
jgi:hypothetical protein